MGSFYFNKEASVLQQLFDKIANLGHATDESSGLMSSDDKAKLDGIEVGAQVNDTKVGVISQTQVWTHATDGGYDYTMSDKVYGPIPQSFIDLWNTLCAVNGDVFGTFNETSCYFELNGLNDISYDEARKIVAYTDVNTRYMVRRFLNVDCRTHLPSSWFLSRGLRPSSVLNDTLIVSYLYLSSLEVVLFPPSEGGFLTPIFSGSAAAFAYQAYFLKKILNPFSVNSTALSGDMFFQAYSLEEIRLYSLKSNISFAHSARLSKESLIYMIENEASEGVPITITLHPTVYAMAMADDDIGHLRLDHQDVILASA